MSSLDQSLGIERTQTHTTSTVAIPQQPQEQLRVSDVYFVGASLTAAIIGGYVLNAVIDYITRGSQEKKLMQKNFLRL